MSGSIISLPGGEESMAEKLFNTEKRIKLGIWGLGRGAHFYKMCKAVHIDVTAGCDFNPVLRRTFQDNIPDAFVTDDVNELLAQDIDAVLLATYCPDHGPHAVKCINAGKHVLSEVTAFDTPADGVKLIEAVESNDLVYNLAENYPFTKERLYLADLWKKGVFGDLIYAENEYNHDSRRPLSFKYLNKEPVQPGWSLHAWRSWKHQHFYSTHSLGPLMHITGGRPVRVVSLPGKNSMAANVSQTKSAGISTVAPSLINLDNGGIVRNFMGSTTHDTHQLRIWGTKAAAEFNKDLELFLGAEGKAGGYLVKAEWPEHGGLAEKMGHGGGDFWVLYYFAREILTGEKAFWNVYRAADVTLAGIFAYRSAVNKGLSFDIPDFRKPEMREAFRNDTETQNPYDWEGGPFPKDADKEALGDFTLTMSQLIDTYATGARAAVDLLAVADSLVDREKAVETLQRFIDNYEGMKRCFHRAEEIIAMYPDSDGALMLSEMLAVAESKKTADHTFFNTVKSAIEQLK
jgi:predicted dehydrogenase